MTCEAMSKRCINNLLLSFMLLKTVLLWRSSSHITADFVLDAYDNALAETINGVLKTEVINRQGSWKTEAAVELAILKWVHWFNHEKLLSSIGCMIPAEAEKMYYDELRK